MSRRLGGRLAALIVLSFLSAACAAPPSQEMDQAQGAIDAARAAGADRYATTEYQAAVKALDDARTAVAQRDYRLALNFALESRMQAQRAAKEAATQQGAMRSSAERRLGEVTADLDQAKERLAVAVSARVPRQALAHARASIATAEGSLQKAGTAIQQGDYQGSQERLAESAKNLKAALAEIESALKARGGRNRS